MKKLLAFILALVAVCSLCACGTTEEYDDDLNDADGNAEIEVDEPEATDPVITDPTDPEDPENAEPEIADPNQTNPDKKPTEEQMQRLETYREAVEKIENYCYGVSDTISWRSENGYFWENHTAEKPNYYVLSSVYHAVADNAELVDEFKYADFDQDFETNWDYEEVLSLFTVIADVRIGCNETTYNAAGNLQYSSAVEYVWYYNREGDQLPVWKSSWYEIVSGLPVYNADTGRLSLTYNYTVIYENGEVKELHYMNNGKVMTVMTPTFGQYGIVSAHVEHSNGAQMDITYTYDDQGRLTDIETAGLYGNYANHYSYNDKGQLVKSWDDKNKTYEYTYDEDGVLISTLTYEVGTYTGAYGHQVITYTYDDQGRVLTASIVAQNATDNAKRVYAFTYGDYYIL